MDISNQCSANNNLTDNQKKALDWLSSRCYNDEKMIKNIYSTAGRDLEKSKCAMRGHFDALKHKGVIFTKPIIRRGSQHIRGLIVKIAPDAFEKYFDLDITILKPADITKRYKNSALSRALLVDGYRYKSGFKGWVKLKVTPKK